MIRLSEHNIAIILTTLLLASFSLPSEAQEASTRKKRISKMEQAGVEREDVLKYRRSSAHILNRGTSGYFVPLRPYYSVPPEELRALFYALKVPKEEQLYLYQDYFFEQVSRQGELFEELATMSETLPAKRHFLDMSLNNLLIAGRWEGAKRVGERLVELHRDDPIYRPYYRGVLMAAGILEGGIYQARQELYQLLAQVESNDDYRHLERHARDLLEANSDKNLQRTLSLSLANLGMLLSIVQGEEPENEWRQEFFKDANNVTHLGFYAQLAKYIAAGKADTLREAYAHLLTKEAKQPNRKQITYRYHKRARRKVASVSLAPMDPDKYLDLAFNDEGDTRAGWLRWQLGDKPIERVFAGREGTKHSISQDLLNTLISLETMKEYEGKRQARAWIDLAKLARKKRFYETAGLILKQQEDGPLVHEARGILHRMNGFPSDRLIDDIGFMLLVDVPATVVGFKATKAGVSWGLKLFMKSKGTSLFARASRYMATTLYHLPAGGKLAKASAVALFSLPLTINMRALHKLMGRPVMLDFWSHYTVNTIGLLVMGGVYMAHRATVPFRLQRISLFQKTTGNATSLNIPGKVVDLTTLFTTEGAALTAYQGSLALVDDRFYWPSSLQAWAELFTHNTLFIAGLHAGFKLTEPRPQGFRSQEEHAAMLKWTKEMDAAFSRAAQEKVGASSRPNPGRRTETKNERPDWENYDPSKAFREGRNQGGPEGDPFSGPTTGNSGGGSPSTPLKETTTPKAPSRRGVVGKQPLQIQTTTPNGNQAMLTAPKQGSGLMLLPPPPVANIETEITTPEVFGPPIAPLDKTLALDLFDPPTPPRVGAYIQIHFTRRLHDYSNIVTD